MLFLVEESRTSLMGEPHILRGASSVEPRRVFTQSISREHSWKWVGEEESES